MSTKTQTAPKSKKVATSPQVKLLTTAVKKTVVNNPVLPILEDILFEPGFATVSDLETSVRVPFALNGLGQKTVALGAKMFLEIQDMLPNLTLELCEKFGATFFEGSRKAKMMGENPDNFPNIPMSKGEYDNIGSLSEVDVSNLETALRFVSNDDLRPAMTGVFFEKKGFKSTKKSGIVATDAHRLYWNHLSNPIKEDFILPQKTIRILLAFGGQWELTSNYKEIENKPKELTHISFTRPDGVRVTSRVIDARFPDYRVVVPEGEGLVKLVVSPDFLLKELKNASKFANRSTNQVTFGMNGMFSMAAQDVDFSFEYHSKFENSNTGDVTFGFSPDYPKRFQWKGENVNIVKDHGSIVELMGGEQVMKEELKEMPNELYIGFNAKFLQEIINELPADEPVNIDMWSPSKCGIINKHFLVMPLMLGQ